MDNELNKYNEQEKLLKKEISTIEAELTRKKKDLTIIRNLKKKLNKAHPKEELEVNEYHQDLSWKMKVLYALTQLKEPRIIDVVELLIKKDKKELNEKTAYQSTFRTLNRLMIDGKVVKIGDYNSKYKLNVK
jgi:hypothetical protein